MAMNTNLIPTVSAINPPAIGPTTGPNYSVESVSRKLSLIINVPTRGPRLYTAMADARSRGAKQSLTDPAPQAKGALPEKPAALYSEIIEICPTKPTYIKNGMQ